METHSLIPTENIKQEPDYEATEREEANIPLIGKEIKQEPDNDDEGQTMKREKNEDEESVMSPVIKRARTSSTSLLCSDEDSFLYCEKCKLKYEGGCTEHGPQIYIDNAETGQGEGFNRDSSHHVQVADNRGKHVPGRERVEQVDVRQGVLYCVQGYLPVSQTEYLQIMPGDRFPELDKQDNLLDELSKKNSLSAKNSISMECCDIVSRKSGVIVTDMSGDSHLESRVKEDNTPVDCVDNKEKRLDVEEAHNDDVGILPNRDYSTESDDMFSVCEMNTELCVAGTSCRLNAKIKKTDQNIHSTEKPFICDVCFVGFSENSGLNRHRRIHTGEKPYKCDVCGVAFAWGSGLKSHKRIHSGEKPYKCDVCGVKFSNSSNLKTHKRTHTGEKPYTGEKSFICNVCDHGFTRHCDLNIHKRTHTGEKPFKCDICGKNFTAYGDLTKHIRVHTGEKPYKCDFCGAGFSRCCSLNRHKRIHTGEKPYKCNVCVAKFAACSDLMRHKKIHSGEKGNLGAESTSTLKSQIKSPKPVLHLDDCMSICGIGRESASPQN